MCNLHAYLFNYITQLRENPLTDSISPFSYLYQIAYLGENDSEIEFSSSMPADEEGFVYETRSLKNLVQVDEWESLCPLVNCNIADVFNEDTPQFFALCGRGARSTLRILRHGLEVTEMAKSELPGSPNAVWTVKRHIDDQQDAYIIVSFVNATLVLSIGETVEEVADSGFLGTTPTIGCGLLGDDSLLQVSRAPHFLERLYAGKFMVIMMNIVALG